MTELTEVILKVVENPTVDSFNKLINVLDDLCDENAILPVPGYYFGKEKGFTFAEVQAEGKVFLTILSEKEYFGQSAGPTTLLGMGIKMFFANYFSAKRFDGIIFNPDTSAELVLTNQALELLKFSDEFN